MKNLSSQADSACFIVLFFTLFNFSLLAQDNYKIHVDIAGLTTGKAELVKLDLQSNETVSVETVDIVAGTFSFQGKIGSPYSHSIIINDKQKIHFFLESGTMHIKGDINILSAVRVSGSKEDKRFRSYPIDSLFEFQTGMEIMTKHTDYTFAAFVAFYQFQIHNYDLNTMGSIINSFSESVKKSIYYAHLIQLYETIKRVSVSQPAPAFSIPNTNGELVQLSDFKGKYVLIDFWASWCAPCRTKHPDLKAVHQAVQYENFEIISISVDKNRKSWLNAIQEDQLTWVNLSNIKGWDEIATLYGVKAIPQNFLINPEGIIIAKNIKAADLLKKLNALFKER